MKKSKVSQPMPPIGNGTLPLPSVFGHEFTVFGGRYSMKPAYMMGVKMAVEISMPCAVDIPTADYSVPSLVNLDRGLNDAVTYILKGRMVYVGCLGGRGRTGLFLAVLAKAFGVKNPVEYVREHYYPHAVETLEQYDFVSEYVIPFNVKRAIFTHRVMSALFLAPKDTDLSFDKH